MLTYRITPMYCSILVFLILKPAPLLVVLASMINARIFSNLAEDYTDLERLIARNFRMHMFHLSKSCIFLSLLLEPQLLAFKVVDLHIYVEFRLNSSGQGLFPTYIDMLFFSPGSMGKSPSQLSDSETFYSTFHTTPERRKLSREEWGKFTRESTRKAMEDLVSSPEFSKWAVAHADRITLAPKKDSTKSDSWRNWFNWF